MCQCVRIFVKFGESVRSNYNAWKGALRPIFNIGPVSKSESTEDIRTICLSFCMVELSENIIKMSMTNWNYPGGQRSCKYVELCWIHRWIGWMSRAWFYNSGKIKHTPLFWVTQTHSNVTQPSSGLNYLTVFDIFIANDWFCEHCDCRSVTPSVGFRLQQLTIATADTRCG